MVALERGPCRGDCPRLCRLSRSAGQYVLDVDAATAKGMIGSPFVLINDEPFFGADRLPHMDWWLQQRTQRA